jgi:hypothetical protein
VGFIPPESRRHSERDGDRAQGERRSESHGEGTGIRADDRNEGPIMKDRDPKSQGNMTGEEWELLTHREGKTMYLLTAELSDRDSWGLCNLSPSTLPLLYL